MTRTETRDQDAARQSLGRLIQGLDRPRSSAGVQPVIAPSAHWLRPWLEPGRLVPLMVAFTLAVCAGGVLLI